MASLLKLHLNTMKQNETTDRIIKVMKECAVSRHLFCEKTSIHPSALHKIFKGQATISLVQMQQISAAFPEVGVGWLFMGKGEFFAPKADHDNDLKEIFRITIRIQDENFNLYIGRRAEAFYREVAMSLQKTIQENNSKFGLVVPEMALKVVAFHLAVEVIKNQNAVDLNKGMLVTELNNFQLEKHSNREVNQLAFIEFSKVIHRYRQKYEGHSERKILTIVAYHFACLNSRISVI